MLVCRGSVVERPWLGPFILVLPYVWLLFMAYQLSGTLVSPRGAPQDWSQLFDYQSSSGQVRDWLENALLAFPAGFLFALLDRAACWSLSRLVLLAVLPFLGTAFGMEFLQRWMPDRTASLWDACFMVLGAGSGAMVGVIAYHGLGSERISGLLAGGDWLRRLVAAAWFASYWIPTNLQLEPDRFPQAVAPLHTISGLSLTMIAYLAISWIAAAELLRAGTLTLALTIGGACLGLLLVPGRAVSLEEITGPLLALILLPIFRGMQSRQTVLLWALGAATVAVSLAEFETRSIVIGSTSFSSDRQLIPASWLAALVLVLRQYFTLAAGLTLSAQAMDPRRYIHRLVPAVGLALIVIEGVRSFTSLGGFRVSLFVAFVACVGLVRVATQRAPGAKDPRRVHAPMEVPRPQAPGDRLHTRWGRRPVCVTLFLSHVDHEHGMLLRVLLRGALIGLAISAAIYVAIQSPQVPYNVRELFGGRLPVIAIPLFAIGLLWTIGAPLLASRAVVLCPVLHLLQPVLFLVCALPSWLFLRYAVSAESLWDVLGYPILGWPGDWELTMRYLALYFPLFLSLFLAGVFASGLVGSGFGVGLASLVSGLFVASPFVLLVKMLVIDEASTDNLRELIVGPETWISLLALFAAFCVVSFNGVLLSKALHRSIQPLVSALIGTPCLCATAWWMLNRGLTEVAVRFLLSPGRDYAAHPFELLLRWVVFYCTAVALVAAVVWIESGVFRDQSRRSVATH